MVITKTDKVLRALASRKPVTSNELTRRSGLRNLSATISRLREQGNDIEFFQRVNSKGKTVGCYQQVA